MHPVAAFGPFFLYELIGREKRIPSENNFSCICDFCNQILNQADSVCIIQKKLEESSPEVRFKLKLAEMVYNNIDQLKISRRRSKIINFCKSNFPAFWKILRKLIKGRK